MNLYGLLASLAWSGVAVYWIRQYSRLIARSPVAPVIEAGDSVSLHASASTAKPAKSAVPDDLVAYANQWGDQWARDDAIESLREKFVEVGGEWNKVRLAVGIGTIDQ